MTKNTTSGFTLIELLIVVVIIGVFCAIVIPTVTHVNQRAALADLVNRFQNVATQARMLALQTRKAAVIEINTTRSGEADNPTRSMWINLLSSADCWEQGTDPAFSPAIDKRCVNTRWETDGNEFISLETTKFIGARTAICQGSTRTLGATCVLNTYALPAGRYALCYSGMGELWIRASADEQTLCTANGAPTVDQTGWTATCSITPPNGSNPSDLFDGVSIEFNRYPNGNCPVTPTTGDARLDIQRVLFLPTRAAPYSRVGQ